MTSSQASVLALCLLFAPACASEGAEVAAGNGVEGDAQPRAVATAAGAADAPALTDPQVAHVAVTANTIDIEMGRMAESRASAAEVRQFATTMITDHTAVNEQAAALAGRLGVTPEDNEVSEALQADATAARGRLETLQGGAFDRAYIDREVAFHQAVLDALDGTLIPAATNAELRGLLEDVRPAIAAHLEHARSLQSTLVSSVP